MDQPWTWHNDKLEPGNCFVEFKLDTPYFGGLSIDRFQMPNEACDEVQLTGRLRWQGNTYQIWPDRTADFRKFSAPYARPIIMFVTTMLNPLPEEKDDS
jgi:phage-related protein